MTRALKHFTHMPFVPLVTNSMPVNFRWYNQPESSISKVVTDQARSFFVTRLVYFVLIPHLKSHSFQSFEDKYSLILLGKNGEQSKCWTWNANGTSSSSIIRKVFLHSKVDCQGVIKQGKTDGLSSMDRLTNQWLATIENHRHSTESNSPLF